MIVYHHTVELHSPLHKPMFLDVTIELGEFGRVCFVDFDGVRARDRTVHFQMMGE